MSEQTRMSKYKDLRDNIDDDMSYVPHEEDVLLPLKVVLL